MLVWENILLAINGLRANKTRAMLTMLGIIIGISSVITIMILGQSLSNGMSSEMGGIGANNITISVTQRDKVEKVVDDRGLVFSDDTKLKTIGNPTESDLITTEMLERFSQRFEGDIKYLCLSGTLGEGSISNKSDTVAATVTYANQDSIANDKRTLTAGRFITEREQSQSKKVCMIGSDVVDKIYGGDPQNVLGQMVDIQVEKKSYSYTVVGVYKKADGISLFDFSLGSKVYIPLTTGLAQLHKQPVFSSVMVVGQDGADVKNLTKEMENYLNEVFYSKNEFFHIYGNTMASLIESLSGIMNGASIGISIIAGISLLVGGIGVMNIMLVSVTERTKEIGTRKALGATNESIRLQFITESVVICIIGGIIGLILGIGMGYLAASLMHNKPSIPISGVILSVVFSSAIGIFFGYAPANKAAQMNPIDALRYE